MPSSMASLKMDLSSPYALACWVGVFCIPAYHVEVSAAVMSSSGRLAQVGSIHVSHGSRTSTYGKVALSYLCVSLHLIVSECSTADSPDVRPQNPVAHHGHHQVESVRDPLPRILWPCQLVDAPQRAPGEQDQQAHELHRRI